MGHRPAARHRLPEREALEKEIADAMAIWEYAKGLPYVSGIGFLGHSQGGVVASMTAGRLARQGSEVPMGLVLIAPGAVIKEACQGGKFFNARFDPKDPPEYIRCWGVKKLLDHASPGRGGPADGVLLQVTPL